ncbi:hypothetical protein CYMTET_41522 [Cymbomonas tetramitiformis]|uniref:Uncharacterized protein n=1 Tax=Cymbomonas tetramitiformis TaxID=36881 RepID=A0AAE0C5W9_9CHLO|nr:hypothetical protein CYMTET_41522 [Cymbomonas tetramitiformis]
MRVNSPCSVLLLGPVAFSNALTAFTPYLYAPIYYAANYDPSLYSYAEIFGINSRWYSTSNVGERSLLPRTVCVGLTHSRCVQQGVGNATLPGGHVFLWTRDSVTYVVHGCERDGYCHCAWLQTLDEFTAYRGDAATGALTQRDHATGAYTTATVEQASHFGFGGFTDDVLEYYVTSTHGSHVTDNGYSEDASESANVLLKHRADFPYWLYAPEGSCVSVCQLLRGARCGRELDLLTLTSDDGFVVGVPPLFLRMGCVGGGSGDSCSTDVHHMQAYPLEAATATLLVAYGSMVQRSLIATNETFVYYIQRMLDSARGVADGTITAEAGARATFQNIVGGTSQFGTFLTSYLFSRSQLLLYCRDVLVAFMQYIRALVLVLYPEGNNDFFTFQRDTMALVSMIEDVCNMFGSAVVRLLSDLINVFYMLFKSVIDALTGQENADDWKNVGHAIMTFLREYGAVLKTVLYRIVFESPLGKIINAIINGTCEAVIMLQTFAYDYTVVVCAILQFNFGGEYSKCHQQLKCHAPDDGDNKFYRPMEASMCETRDLDGVFKVYRTDELPVIDGNAYEPAWMTECSVCWATSEAMCLETKTGVGNANNVRGRVWDMYGEGTHAAMDSLQLCGRHTREDTCEAEVTGLYKMAICYWDEGYEACLGRRTVKAEYFGTPCLCEMCAAGVHCGGSGYCTCGAPPYLTLGLECAPSYVRVVDAGVTTFERAPGVPGEGCGECPSRGVRDLASTGSARDAVCYVRQAEMCTREYRSRVGEGLAMQSVSDCLAALRVMGPFPCASHCDKSVTNEDNLLFAGAVVDLRASGNLDLFENAKLTTSEVPVTTLCTCDLNLLAILQEATRAGEDDATNDVTHDAETGGARKVDAPPPPPAGSTSARRLLVDDDATDGIEFTASAIRHARRTLVAGSPCVTHRDCHTRADAVCQNHMTYNNTVTLCAGCARSVMAGGPASRRCDAVYKVCVCGAPNQADDLAPTSAVFGAPQESRFQYVMDAQLWPGDTQCDHLMRALSTRPPPTTLRGLDDVEASLAWHCVRMRFYGMELASALDMPSLPADVFYNTMRPIDLARSVAWGVYLMTFSLPENATLPAEVALYDAHGLDAEMIVRVRTGLVDPMRAMWHGEVAHLKNFTFAVPDGAISVTALGAMNGSVEVITGALNLTRAIHEHVASKHPRISEFDFTAAFNTAHSAIAAGIRAVHSRWFNRSRVYGDADYAHFFKKQYPLVGAHPLKAMPGAVQSRVTGDLAVATHGPDRHAPASRRLTQYLNSTSGTGTLYSHSRTADCAITNRVMDGVGDVVTYASRYYGVQDDLTESKRNHTFQHSVCALLRAANFLPLPTAATRLARSCHTDPTGNLRALDGRSPYQLAVAELKHASTWVDTALSGNSENRVIEDLTRTTVRGVKARDAERCDEQTATRMILCYGESLLRNFFPTFAFDTDVTDFFVNNLFQQNNDSTADDDVRSINNLSFYDTDFIGVYYVNDLGIGLHSEHLAQTDAVRFHMRDVRRPLGNWPSDTAVQTNEWARWYARWAEEGYADVAGVSTVVVQDRNDRTYVDFNFYSYRQIEPNQTYWANDLAARGGFVPAQIFAAACELRDNDPTAKFDERTLCNRTYYGADALGAWASLGYGSRSSGYWFKDEVDFTGDLRNSARYRRLAQLVANLDYPDPPHRLRHDSADSTILRYDDYASDYYESASVRSRAYVCTCPDRYSSTVADQDRCLAERICAAVRANATHAFVYDHGVWWDCRGARALFPSDEWHRRACHPVYHRNIDTLASNRPFRAVHAAERSDRSAGTCEQRGILDCGRRRFDWPILPTAMFNALIGVAIGAPVIYVGGSSSAPYVATVDALLVVHATLQTTYEWQLDCYPALPTCLMDDIATDVETYLLPDHIAWPETWAKRDPVSGRLHDNIDCASDPYGFVDGLRNAVYIWEREHPDSLESFRTRKSTRWIAKIFTSYAHYYDGLHDMNERARHRMDACHDRTVLNYVPAGMLVGGLVVATAYAIVAGLLLTVNFMAVYSELRQVMEYALIVNENRVYARTLQDAQRDVEFKMD